MSYQEIRQFWDLGEVLKANKWLDVIEDKMSRDRAAHEAEMRHLASKGKR